MPNKPNDSQVPNEIVLDQFYQKEKQVEKKQVSIYLDTDVIVALNKCGKQKGKGAKSDLVNNFLKQAFGITQGQQVATAKTAEQMNASCKNYGEY
ncbi:hypothetical protein [Lysinibacillus fusiformis]|uniref:hypothetical protein n=1 Tax=Lysinibacillus fusiformis TaxID=28031 RepID=UPI00187F2AA8|nr:hypothetical protein [Lysinibacillus fusiformis]MBD8522306.1 hypothetical protein [Lysinibacillus fusiformis]